MKKTIVILMCVFVFVTGVVWADTFGTGDNQFEIDFVTISGDASSANGTAIGNGKPEGFIDPGYDYRIGVYEITNAQWNKFKADYGAVTGSPSSAYDNDTTTAISNYPARSVSWYETAQFVNWLNISSGHDAAYKFTGTQGTGDYTFVPWDVADIGYDASNPYRNSNAYYFLPTEDEWVKAAYWNGTNLQTYATIGDVFPVAGVDNNFDDAIGHTWSVGSGSEELNGTYDMMGNVGEWMESLYTPGDYLSSSTRTLRGESYSTGASYMDSFFRTGYNPDSEFGSVGFRVASVIPEPCTLLLLGLGGLILYRKNSNSKS